MTYRSSGPGRARKGRLKLACLKSEEPEKFCGSHKDVEVHHIRALKDLKKRNGKEPPRHVQIMAAHQRKTLVVCKDCHTKIHQGKL